MVVTHVLDTQKWTYCMLQDTKFQLPVYFHSKWKNFTPREWKTALVPKNKAQHITLQKIADKKFANGNKKHL